MSCTMTPSRSSPFCDLTMPLGPPASRLASPFAPDAGNASAAASPRLAIRAARILFAMVFSRSPILRIERRCVRIPAAFLPHEGDEIVDVGVAQRVLVGRHAGAAVADAVLD